jgi:hypothetical protein
MGEFPRKVDGRRVFTPEFMRNVVQQIQKGGAVEVAAVGDAERDDHVRESSVTVFSDLSRADVSASLTHLARLLYYRL